MDEQIEAIAGHVREAHDQFNEAVAQADFAAAFAIYWRFKQDYSTLDEARRTAYAELERMERGALPELFERMGTDMFRHPELQRAFYPLRKHSVSIRDKDALIRWLAEQGAPNIVQQTVNASTLTAFLKSLLTEFGIEAPPDVAQLSEYTIVGSSTYRPK